MQLIQDWLIQSIDKLESAGIATARLDALVLLEDSLNKDRSYILAHSEAVLSNNQVKKLSKQLKRRLDHEPIAYIVQKKEFYGRIFYVNHGVLVPRPETEAMIELLLELDLPKRPLIVDIGAGCGNLAITAKLEFPDARVIATDIDPKALAVARKNAQKLGTNVDFLQGNLLQPILNSKFNILDSILLANLPYVPDKFKINHAARHEPRQAIFGGKDGLNIYRDFWQQVGKLQQKPKYVLTESLPFQHAAMLELAQLAGFKPSKSDGLIQLFYSKVALLNK